MKKIVFVFLGILLLSGCSKDLNEPETVDSLHNKLAGNWSGHAVLNYGMEWDLEIAFDSNGYCYGRITSELPQNEPCLSCFWIGSTLYFDEDYNVIYCSGNSNYPCQRLLIEDVYDNVGSGKVWIGIGYVYADNSSSYDCSHDNFYLDKIEFVDHNEVVLRLKSFDNIDQIEYNLSRK